MKKFISLLLSAIMLLSLCACGSQKDKVEEDAAEVDDATAEVDDATEQVVEETEQEHKGTDIILPGVPMPSEETGLIYETFNIAETTDGLFDNAEFVYTDKKDSKNLPSSLQNYLVELADKGFTVKDKNKKTAVYKDEKHLFDIYVKEDRVLEEIDVNTENARIMNEISFEDVNIGDTIQLDFAELSIGNMSEEIKIKEDFMVKTATEGTKMLVIPVKIKNLTNAEFQCSGYDSLVKVIFDDKYQFNGAMSALAGGDASPFLPMVQKNAFITIECSPEILETFKTAKLYIAFNDNFGDNIKWTEADYNYCINIKN